MFIFPIEKEKFSISQKFGGKNLDYSQFGLSAHNGMDFAAPRGTPIRAVYDGFLVEQTAKETGFGLRVTQRIEFGKKLYMVIYGHMLRLELNRNIAWNWQEKGFPVKQGQIIGYVDSTGFSTGDHLHFGLYPMDEAGNKLISNSLGGAIDPWPFFMNEFIRIINYKGEVMIGVAAENLEALKALGKAFGKTVEIDEHGNVTNADITIT